jgi:hydroxybutyrate-dimer hydrolase
MAPSRPALLPEVVDVRESVHRDGDDLLAAGLGEAGLRSAVPPAFANAEQPSAAELRRRAIWSNWRGIADLAPGGGYGEFYGTLAPVPGREFHAFATLPNARQPHRVMLQVPDAFAADKRCLVVAASSGSRGIYGAIALAGAWGLAQGCAVAYTDKGAGTDYVAADAAAPIAIKHAHSGDNPEADWGRHVLQAAQFALQTLDSALPQQAPFTAANTRIIAVGVSNGGGAVLRAAEDGDGWLDAVVAISPNVLAPEGGRALYDYATEAALWMPCALNASAFDTVALARPAGAKSAAGALRCASLQAAGSLRADAADAQAEEARQYLHQAGWSDEAIAAGALSSAFDLWRAVAVTYASAYSRRGPAEMPCGYAFHAVGADGKPRAPTAVERAAWWSDSSGVPPGAGVAIFDSKLSGSDPMLPGLNCLRSLWDGEGGDAATLRNGIAATRSAPPAAGLPVLVIHGVDDGLVPEAFSSAAYERSAEAAGRDVRYWRVRNAQHFDAFLGLPTLALRYVPLMPYAYRGLDAVWQHLSTGKALPGDAEIVGAPRAFANGSIAPLSVESLGNIPR